MLNSFGPIFLGSDVAIPSLYVRVVCVVYYVFHMYEMKNPFITEAMLGLSSPLFTYPRLVCMYVFKQCRPTPKQMTIRKAFYDMIGQKGCLSKLIS